MTERGIMEDERKDNEETKDMADTAAPATETDDAAPEESDPMKELLDGIASLRTDIESFKGEMGSIREMLGALGNQKAVDVSIGAEDEDFEDDEDGEEYPEVDLDDLAKTIGGF